MTNWQERDSRRQDIIQKAVTAADCIIFQESDGTVEETNFLTAMVAEIFVRKMILPTSGAMLDADIKADHPELAEAAEAS